MRLKLPPIEAKIRYKSASQVSTGDVCTLFSDETKIETLLGTSKDEDVKGTKFCFVILSSSYVRVVRILQE